MIQTLVRVFPRQQREVHSVPLSTFPIPPNFNSAVAWVLLWQPPVQPGWVLLGWGGVWKYCAIKIGNSWPKDSLLHTRTPPWQDLIRAKVWARKPTRRPNSEVSWSCAAPVLIKGKGSKRMRCPGNALNKGENMGGKNNSLCGLRCLIWATQICN